MDHSYLQHPIQHGVSIVDAETVTGFIQLQHPIVG